MTAATARAAYTPAIPREPYTPAIPRDEAVDTTPPTVPTGLMGEVVEI